MAPSRLSRRFAWPLLLGGLLYALVLVLALERIQARSLVRDLAAGADIVAAALQHTQSTTDDLAGLTARAVAISPDVRAALLLDTDGERVIAGSRPEWTGRAVSELAQRLYPTRDGAGWQTPTPHGHVFALPVTLRDGAAGNRQFLLALVMDGSRLAAADAENLASYTLAVALGALLLAAGAFLLLRVHVLNPLARIRNAVADRRLSAPMPVGRNDEIGALATLLQQALAERHAQQLALQRSEERLQLAVAGSRDGLFDYDSASRDLYLSKMLRGWVFGSDIARSSLGLDEVLTVIHPDHLSRVRATFRACAGAGTGFDIEVPLAKADGGWRWLQVRGRGVPLETGLYRVSGFATDISRRKVAENLLHDSVARLGAVLDNIAEGIVTLNQAGEVCAVNLAARQMFAVDRDALVGQPLADLLELPPGTDRGWTPLADRQPRACRVLPRSDGAEPGFVAEFAVSAMNIRSDERFIVVLRDISDRRMAEDRMRAAIDQARAATRAKDEFLATMSHEIRTPMNGVMGMTQLLMDMDLAPSQRETAQLILSSGESLLTIIDDILDFTRAGSGHLSVDALPFDLRQTIREVVELLGRGNSGVDLYVDYPLALPEHLVGDRVRVRQVLMNLVGNALKFTASGHVAVTVSLQPEETAAVDPLVRLMVSVEDTGPGIPLAVQGQLFRPFTQADASTTRMYGGTGLGLAISRTLVELMGGAIGLTSEVGKGSTFRFSLNLPLAQAPDQPAAWRASTAAFAGRRALVVDDDPRGRQVLAGYLESAGMAVTAVDSAPRALEILEQDCFDLTLIDDRMPGMDGLLLAELVRMDGARDGMCQILLCTGHTLGVEHSRALDRCLVKPALAEVLLPAAAELLAAAGPAAASTAATVAFAEPSVKAASPGEPAPPVGANLRVLLAEDNVVNQKVAVRMLERLGCRVDVAADGAEAVALCRHFDYDLVFMDCQMPRLDGLEATRQIRRLQRSSERTSTAIIAMTANAMDRDRAACMQAGMNDYLSKPVRQADLQATLLRWSSWRAQTARRTG